MTAEKVREDRLRRMAARQGLKLTKSKTRDPRALSYGCWMIVNTATNAVEAGDRGHMGIDDVEKFLTEGK